MALAEAVNAFETFGPAHLAAMALTVLAAAALPLWARRARSVKLTRRIGLAIAAALLANEAVYYATGLATLPLIEFARRHLPVHVCGAAVYLTAWTLWRRGRRAYEVAYFWGLGGTLQAILTPNLVVDFPSRGFFQFFITHSGIVVGVVFATLALRLRPGRGAVLRVFLISNLYMAGVAGIDWLLGANYMFLPAGREVALLLPPLALVHPDAGAGRAGHPGGAVPAVRPRPGPGAPPSRHRPRGGPPARLMIAPLPADKVKDRGPTSSPGPPGPVGPRPVPVVETIDPLRVSW